jgi:hypothetical protein
MDDANSPWSMPSGLVDENGRASNGEDRDANATFVCDRL